ncbi:MAG TPA: bacillithiol biosynthesis cysteine-adding enzyme BshC, partial [Gemmatimonadales bacterium]|nr:bacillithiol biosynthesis cysteine-adding enzyme BshC [Gemmatimonadales bacterium]
VLTTPLPVSPREPAQRDGGIDPSALGGFLIRPGLEAPLERLRDPGVLVVTTGQQPALFTGPVYTVFKALSAAALAAVLEERWERPVVPVFWIAGDDHDWEEARSASWLGADDTLVTASLRNRPASDPMAPLSREPLGAEVGAALELLNETLAGTPHREHVLQWLGAHFTPDTMLAAASGAALADLLAPFGIVCFDSTLPAVKRGAARHLVKALGLAADLDRDLGRRAAELANEERDAGIAVGDGATLVMLDDAGGRDRLVLVDGGFETRRGGERFTLEQLHGIAASEPERLSANVLLRPVIESALLPTVAYCAGPGELRYLPLCRPVFERMRIHRPEPVPRWSGLVVEAFADRAARKFRIPVADIADPSAAVTARAVRDRIPDATRGAIDSLRDELARRYRDLGEQVAALDPTLERPVDGALGRSLDALDRVDRKLVRSVRRRHEIELRQLLRARTALLPGGKPQERVLTAASFLARHGPAVFEECARAAAGWYQGALEGRALIA